MKTSAAEQRHHDAIVELAKDYRGKGYEVIVDPSPEDVPEFLRPYRPDLLVIKGDERYVIEIATPRSSRKDKGFWASLAHKIANQPGWHFKIIAIGLDEEEGDAREYSLPHETEIRDQLKGVSDLARHGQNVAALLLAWSLFEAAARLRMMEDDRDPGKPTTPSELIKSLIYYGHLGQSEFNPLRRVMELRNRAAHGYFDTPIPVDDVNLLIGTTERLLQPASDE